ncbi:hypothetical protein BXY70_0422 [Roseovarius halotolerans]|uniref:NfeD-like C-terminal domain-containing protein n=1 Tax=Roseovarius halotolerans TaxID=505353 RepID=A0A1X6YK13_9RHOB|nr:hypothetical protein [Roseovarius halotolerans]RKT34405.1 hypothetical protein BXY70_0422 [Roseovarius halotolerans]SLN23683.1 hypothetical protein ROH8110_00973 [Roseovarius halotolerans]
MSGIWTLWWVWLGGALALAILETLIPGYVFLGIALGAASMALIVALPITLAPAAMIAIFAFLSLLAWIILRRVFQARNDQSRVIHDDINK